MRLLIQQYLIVLLLIAMIAVVLLPNVATGLAADGQNSADALANEQNIQRVFNSQNGTLSFVALNGNSTVQVMNPAQGLLAIQPYMNGFGLTNLSEELSYVDSQQLMDGSSVYRYQQVYHDVPVFLGEIIVNGNRSGKLNAIAGDISPNLDQKQIPFIPELSSDEAILNALEFTNAYYSNNEFSLFGAPELWIYDSSLLTDSNEPIELIWEVKLVSEDHYYLFSVLVSAQTGGIRLNVNLNASEQAPVASENGVDTVLNPDSPPSLPFAAPNHNLTIRTYDSNDSSNTQGAGSSTLVCSTIQPASDPALSGAGSCDGTGTITDANAAQHFGVRSANFFDAQFNRNSYDGGGSELNINIDWCSNCPVLSSVARWDLSISQVLYGNQSFLSTDENAARTYMHGIIANGGANFYNYYESGAIRNVYGDIFGEFYDLYNGVNSNGGADAPGDSWKFGEDTASGVSRDLADPTALNQPDRMQSTLYLRVQGATYSTESASIGGTENGGIFTNVGVGNKAAYLMTAGGNFNGQNVSPLAPALSDSILLSSRIWYDAQFLLPTGADYGQLATALSSSCTNLIGLAIPNTGETISAGDCTQVSNAITAVEMSLEPELAPDYNDYSPEAPITCDTPGASPLNLFFEGFESGNSLTAPVLLSGNAPQWNTDNFYAHSGTTAYYGVDVIGSDNYVAMQAGVALTGSAAGEYYLHFAHSYGFENDNANANFNALDGAVLEYTTNGGASWADAQSLFEDGNDYHPTQKINGATDLFDRNAFLWDSHGYVESRYDLSSLAGQTINFRWRMATDGAKADLGWFLDDITIYRCEGGTPTTPPPTTEPPPGPSNDLFPNAINVPSLPNTPPTTNILSSTLSVDDPDLWCAPGAISNTVWYRYTANGNFYLNINSNGSAYDTVLGVYTGTQGNLANVACDNNGGQGGLASLVGLSTKSGITYHIMVANNSGTPVAQATTLQLNLSSEPNHSGLVLFNSSTSATSIISSLGNSPLASAYVDYTNTPAITNGNRWYMGDWNGDGVDTPAYYANGPFFFTNDIGPTSNWSGIWLGMVNLNRPIVIGRMHPGFSNDCVGIVNHAVKPNGDQIFAVYYWCDMANPPTGTQLGESRQFMGAILPSSSGRVGTFEFGLGDWDADGIEEMASRRGEFISYSFINPTAGPATFGQAQRWGTPAGQNFDDGQFVTGNWDGTAEHGWGVVYEENIFYYRNSLVWNPGAGVYNVQNFSNHVGGTYQPFTHNAARGGAGPAAPIVVAPVDSGNNSGQPAQSGPATSTPISVVGIAATPTDVPPTDVPPTDVPPTDVPPTDVPPTDVPPTDVPPTETPEPVHLPVVENMDDGAPLWTATGSWELTQNASYNPSGLGWIATQTLEASALQFNHPINLGNVAYPNLRFQTNMIATQSVGQIEISIDGQIWLPIAIVGQTDGWEEQSVDLRDYRSMTIWLRFNWLSAPTSDGFERKGETWMIDELDLRNHPLETPTAEPTVVDPEPTEDGDPIPTDVPPAGVTPTNTPLPDATQIGIGTQ